MAEQKNRQSRLPQPSALRAWCHHFAPPFRPHGEFSPSQLLASFWGPIGTRRFAAEIPRSATPLIVEMAPPGNFVDPLYSTSASALAASCPVWNRTCRHDAVVRPWSCGATTTNPAKGMSRFPGPGGMRKGGNRQTGWMAKPFHKIAIVDGDLRHGGAHPPSHTLSLSIFCG